MLPRCFFYSEFVLYLSILTIFESRFKPNKEKKPDKDAFLRNTVLKMLAKRQFGCAFCHPKPFILIWLKPICANHKKFSKFCRLFVFLCV